MKALPNGKMRDATTAFHWIVGLLREQDIPFVIVGGLAAKAFGVTRQLNDIDIDIPDEAFPLIEPLVRDHLTEGPERYRDEQFDLLQMTLEYKGQDIELTGADSCRLCDSRTGQWLELPTDIEAIEWRTILGLKVPVMERSTLIAYKRLLGRDMDRQDIEAMSRLFR